MPFGLSNRLRRVGVCLENLNHPLDELQVFLVDPLASSVLRAELGGLRDLDRMILQRCLHRSYRASGPAHVGQSQVLGQLTDDAPERLLGDQQLTGHL
jgi:hypothetical protein